METLPQNNNTDSGISEKPSKISRKRHVVKSFEAKLTQQRTIGERSADFINKLFGSLSFVVFNMMFFVVWIFWNLDLLGLEPFDPYPFGLLTTIVSLEAIFLSIFVLISQNRSAKIDKLRSEVDLQINLTAEQEVTKVLSLLTQLMQKHGFPEIGNDPELQRMLRQIDAWEIERKLEKDLEEKSR